MVGLLKRMRRLNSLLDIRFGPGAAIISSDVKRIHLNFAKKINDGHMGPRKFWQQYLPRLKYHNPAVPMTVEVTSEQEGPATLTVFFSSSLSNDETLENHVPEHSKAIDMKRRTEGDILQELMKLVDGKPVIASAAEEAQRKELEAELRKSEEDRVRQAEFIKKKRRERELLEQARQSM